MATGSRKRLNQKMPNEMPPKPCVRDGRNQSLR